MSVTDLLIFGGTVVAGASLVIGIVTIVALWIIKLRLNSKLDYEYGKKEK